MERIDNIVKKKTTKYKFDGIFKKLKSVKNIEVIIAAIFIGIVLLIFFSGDLFSTSGESDTITFSLDEYGNAVETKMEDILCKISGAGDVKVMITFESGVEIITAETVNKQSNIVTDEYSGGYRETESLVESNTPVIISGNAVILKEIQPKVKGAVIVSEGAGSIQVKIELIKAVSTLLSLEPENIEIFEMSK